MNSDEKTPAAVPEEKTVRKTARHRGSVFRDTIISAAAAFAAEAALVVVLTGNILESMLSAAGFEGSADSLLADHFPLAAGGCLAAGILVYSVVFSLQRRSRIRYLSQFATALSDISEGNFYRSVPVVGDDELADIALQLNHMTEEIRILIDREKEAEQTKTDLITNVAHDLRTPLTSVIGYLDLIRRQPGLDEQTKQAYLQVAYDKARHLQVLIEDLFGFTKLNYGSQTANMKPLDLIRLLGQLLDEFYAVFEQNQIVCEYHPDRPAAMINGDGVLLARLFDNLLGNAVKYGKEGKRIVVNTRTLSDSITVSVINYGKVIGEKDLEHIFDKFYRAEHSRSSSAGGTGLGLAIAKNISELHGGSIRADSSLDGTVFEVTLPLAGEAPAQTEQA